MSRCFMKKNHKIDRNYIELIIKLDAIRKNLLDYAAGLQNPLGYPAEKKSLTEQGRKGHFVREIPDFSKPEGTDYVVSWVEEDTSI